MCRCTLRGLCQPVVLIALIAGCAPRAGDPLLRRGDEIVAAGQFFHTGTPVVLWLEPKGYNAYRGWRHSNPDEVFPAHPEDSGNASRYSPSRLKLAPDLEAQVKQDGWTLANLQQQVDQFVIHYDACGTSAFCFYVLQDDRGLSVHFMLDLDGMVYQTLDLAERAWHASTANNRSVGIEIANIGAYPKDAGKLDEWYCADETGWPRITIPERINTQWPVRTPQFVARPARRDRITGTINGRELVQYDYTHEQYRALIKLTAALRRIFPKLKLDAPRNPDGSVNPNVLSEEQLSAYSGLLGHQNVTAMKVDPGPAFDWDRLLRNLPGSAETVGLRPARKVSG